MNFILGITFIFIYCADMEFLSTWLLVVTVFGVAVLSPGPDFIMTVRNAVVYNRRAGLLSSFGLALGIVVHVSYSLVGIAALISKSILLYTAIKYMGAAYLIYLGAKGLLSKGQGTISIDENDKNTLQIKSKTKKTISDFNAIKLGFLTNALNPKATMFFLALFTQIISPSTPILAQIIYGLTCSVLTGVWFCLVTLFLTNKQWQARFLECSKWIDKGCGALLIAFGLKVALSEA